MKKDDLKGKAYGGLEVIESAPSRKTPSGQTVTYWLCRCLKCGSLREYSAQNIKHGVRDCGCGRNAPIEVGKKYGFITVLSVAQEKPKKYNCRCEKCGKLFVNYAQGVREKQNTGCRDCSKSQKNSEKIEFLKGLYEGKQYGELTILDISLKKEKDGNGLSYLKPYALCKCSCGAKKEIRLDHILSGNSTTCGHDTRKNLGIGWKMASDAAIDGTSVLCIKPGRKLNKNNTTGISGVCKTSDGACYRAYINFRRKQYDLGVYSRIEDAIEARKKAEKEIYGDFLGWYAQNYPEQWKAIEKRKNLRKKNETATD